MQIDYIHLQQWVSAGSAVHRPTFKPDTGSSI